MHSDIECATFKMNDKSGKSLSVVRRLYVVLSSFLSRMQSQLATWSATADFSSKKCENLFHLIRDTIGVGIV